MLKINIETQSVPLRFKGFWLHLFLKPAMILYIQRYVFLVFLLLLKKKIKTSFFALDPVTALVHKRTEKTNFCLKLL